MSFVNRMNFLFKKKTVADVYCCLGVSICSYALVRRAVHMSTCISLILLLREIVISMYVCVLGGGGGGWNAGG